MKDEFKQKLSPEQLRVCGLGGTEAPFTGKYNKHYEPGAYHCVACDQHLFDSETKFDSGSGWPSFWDANQGSTLLIDDFSYGMHRIEVKCSGCEAHLGHVFEDGPKPTGKRWCINSVALNFKPRP